MTADPQDVLGRHSKRARVIWYPGSTPVYSSLWITVQRFLMLNQPTRAAFTQDFLVTKRGSTTLTPSAYLVGRDRCPMRLARFARVLKEPLATFRCCHLSQFSPAVRPYFGDFSACPDCLREGFHSVLFSFTGLRECPVHHIELWCRAFDTTIPSPLLFNELAHPYLRCDGVQYDLEYAVARAPKANANRDLALGDIADWLLAVGTRCWISAPTIAVNEVRLADFTRRVTRLTAALNLPGIVPCWMATRDPVVINPSTLEIVRFGTVKAQEKRFHWHGDKWPISAHIDLNLYYRTLFFDFKAIHRHLKHQLRQRGRHWLARLTHAADEAEISVIRNTGGVHAQRAWDVLLWWRAVCYSDFKSTPSLLSRPFCLAMDRDIPTGLGHLPRSKSGVSDSVHLWLVRWIGATGLLAFWRAIRGVAPEEKPPALPVSYHQLAQARREPDWCLGISAQQELTLCIEHPNKMMANPPLGVFIVSNCRVASTPTTS